jgi:replicative DNA helicase
MNRDEAKIFIKKQSPRNFLQLDKQKKGYICPYCGNGSGKKGDGIRKIPNKDTYKCFSCGKAADIFDLIGAEFGIDDFNGQFKKAAEIYGVDIEKQNVAPTNNQKESNVPKSTSKPDEHDVSDYIEKCHKAASETSFYRDRGISDEMVDKFKLGYDAHCTESVGAGNSWKAAIIPTSNFSYEIRNTEVPANDAANGSNKYRKHGATVLFNGSVLSDEKDKPIFVCEGAIDAISIIQCGGQAVALGSANNYKLLLKELDKITPSKPLILTLDNDDAGNSATSALGQELDNRKVPYILATEVIDDNYHDPNDRLLKDKDGLIEAIAVAENKSSLIKSPDEIAKDNYLQSSVAHSIGAFRSMICESELLPRLSTGFEELDDALNGGLYTGLYIIGAISSLGKTTLTLQIADNLSQQGGDVLFFSLEQSRFELMSKSISRETYLYCIANGINKQYAKSSIGISDGRRYKNYDTTDTIVIEGAFSKYKGYSEHLFIYEGIGNISVDEIRETVKKHISFTGNKRPIVFIDYLQILAAAEGYERASDKQIVDHNVTALKQLSRDFDIPVFSVSSLNRENYVSEINMSAFKESGAIEYGSDVLIGLQLKGTGEKDFNLNDAKSKDPREVEFRVLKARNGKITRGGVAMKYYPVFNYFECS